MRRTSDRGKLGTRKAVKKAYVTLEDGNTIDVGYGPITVTAERDPSRLPWGDLADMLRACLQTDGLGYQVFNVSSDEMSVDATTAEVCARFYDGVPVKGELGPNQTLYSSEKAKRMVGYRPSHSWQGLKG